MKKTFLFVMALCLGASAFAKNAKPFVVPELKEWKGAASGEFVPAESMRIVCGEDSVLAVGKLLARDWAVMFGGSEPQVVKGRPARGDISLVVRKERIPGGEGYSLGIAPGGVTVAAQTLQGLYWATRTVLQIADRCPARSMPAGTVRDWPDYSVRGLMIDAGRKFIPLDYLEDLAKVMSYHKMNTLQIHLNDNGFKQFFGGDWGRTYAAFRLESETYPGLAARDGYYTKEEFGRFQDWAAEIGVKVIPEIDVPAHTLAFTHYRPELGSKEYGMDHLDLFYPGLYPFFDNLFREYLEGENPVFRGNIVHIGTDEYSNRDQATVEKFREFTDHYIRYVESFGKTACVWGSLSYAKGTTPVKADGVVLQSWSKDFAVTEDMLKAGYDIISIPDRYVYIVPEVGYYYNYLNTEWLYENWTPVHMVDTVYEERHPGILGGMFAEWNDHCGNGISVQDIHHRMIPAVRTIAVKTWNPAPVLPYAEFAEGVRSLREAPGVNRLATVGEPGQTVLAIDKVVPGQELPVREIGYGYTVSFDLKASAEDKGTVLFDSGNAVFYLSDPVSGMFGFARDGYLYTFGYRPYPGEKVRISVEGDNRSTSLYVNGELFETLDIRKQFHAGADRPTYQVRTLVFPLCKVGEFRSAVSGLEVMNYKKH